jgi:hypothetical protein
MREPEIAGKRKDPSTWSGRHPQALRSEEDSEIRNPRRERERAPKDLIGWIGGWADRLKSCQYRRALKTEELKREFGGKTYSFGRVQSSFLLPLNPKTLAIVSVRYGVISFGRENKVIKEIRNSFKVSSSWRNKFESIYIYMVS